MPFFSPPSKFAAIAGSILLACKSRRAYAPAIVFACVCVFMCVRAMDVVRCTTLADRPACREMVPCKAPLYLLT